MTRREKQVPDLVHQAAESAWGKWRDKLAAEPMLNGVADKPEIRGRVPDPDAWKTPEDRMIAKIKRRMKEYPEWYETEPSRVACYVVSELERIGGILDRELPTAKDPVEVWQIPLSVFNWLVPGEAGESFVHGALSAWSSAENFNAANAQNLSDAQKAKLREPFLEIAPVLLETVLDELLTTDLRITFAEQFVGPELKYLVMRVQRPL